MILNEDNFKLLCAKHYDGIDVYSFNEDISRIYMIRKMLRKYIISGDINERLCLNHVIILYNVFGDFLTEILYFVFEDFEYKYINSFLLFLGRMPENKFEFGIDLILTKKLEQL